MYRLFPIAFVFMLASVFIIACNNSNPAPVTQETASKMSVIDTSEYYNLRPAPEYEYGLFSRSENWQ
ncbi:MAG TPA: hypothetical protein VN726_01985 [Hanamia sp.]|jgi:hypothetical protein|nr:hypothetical protein [Hanamia sp.]